MRASAYCVSCRPTALNRDGRVSSGKRSGAPRTPWRWSTTTGVSWSERGLSTAAGVSAFRSDRAARVRVRRRWSVRDRGRMASRASAPAVHRLGRSHVCGRPLRASRVRGASGDCHRPPACPVCALATSARGRRPAGSSGAAPKLVRLTPRELEVINLVALGLSGPRGRPGASDRPRHCAHPRPQRHDKDGGALSRAAGGKDARRRNALAR